MDANTYSSSSSRRAPLVRSLKAGETLEFKRALREAVRGRKSRAQKQDETVNNTKDTTKTRGSDDSSSAGYYIDVPRWKVADVVGVLVSLLLCPLMIVSYVITLVYMIPPFVVGRLYLRCLSQPPIPTIERTCGFRLLCFALWIYSLPVILWSLLYNAIVFGFNTVVCVPVGLLYKSPHWLSNWKLLTKNAVTARYLWPWMDIVVGIMGAMHRQGFFEFYPRFPRLLYVTPILKYVFVTNPWTQTLKETYCNQWTEPIAGGSLDEETIYAALVKSVSYAILSDEDRDDVDEDVFSAYYQFPPPNSDDENRSVTGVQFMSSVINFTHTRHDWEGKAFRSGTASRGVYTVPLTFLNPYHVLTGHVEVNIQPNRALEHPMWCLVGDSRFSLQVYHNVEVLFFGYAPEIKSFVEDTKKESGGAATLGGVASLP